MLKLIVILFVNAFLLACGAGSDDDGISGKEV